MKLECIHEIFTPHTSLLYMNTHQSLRTPVFSWIWVADCIKQGHVLTTTCDFKWGGAKKPIAPITVKKNCLDLQLYQAQKYPLIVFHWVGMSVNTLATLLEALLPTDRQIDRQTDRHTDTKILLYPCCACARG